MFNPPKLVAIDKVAPADYNPRKLDRERLELIKLSLSKLGFLLPIYATRGGELLSGHQRQLAARECGFEEVPVVFVDTSDERSKAINIVFNRGTNDFSKAQSTKQVFSALLDETVKTLTDLPTLTGSDRFPCMVAQPVPVKELIAVNSPSMSRFRYQYQIAKVLYGFHVLMPVVCGQDLQVVNGAGRLILAASLGFEAIDAVVVPDWKAVLAQQCLNCLTMDFTFQDQYKDILRYNSFRRSVHKRNHLGRGFTFAVASGKPSRSVDLSIPAQKRKYISTHGKRLIDFGAGHLTETEILRKHGFHVTPFEPYKIAAGTNEISKSESVEIALAFLEEVAKGTEWDSIFISSVLNSVPFERDRQHIVCLTAALASPKTKVYAVVIKYDRFRAETVEDLVITNACDASKLPFALDYEPRITIGEINKQPKVQKFHTVKEFKSLFLRNWKNVSCKEVSTSLELIGWNPLPIDIQQLAEAIEFEFDLPYPDGSRMGLVDVAKAAYAKRLGVKL